MTCYEDSLKENPKLQGKVVYEWTINQEGAVQNAKIKSSELKSDKVETCLIKELGSLKFQPAPTDQTVLVTYPMVFGSNKK